jgi:protein-disulfide isomerase
MRASTGSTWCVLLSLAGIALAAYLFSLHIGLLRGEVVGGAACGTTGAFNCHAVTGGPWGRFLGIPLSLWGLAGYSAVFALSLLAKQAAEWTAHAMTLIFAAAALFVGLDLFLFGIMAFVIRFYCFFCLLTYAVNLSLLVVSASSLGRPWPQALGSVGSSIAAVLPSDRRPATLLFWGILLIAAAGSAALQGATMFMSQGAPGAMRQQLREFVSKQTPVRVETADDPRIGSPDAEIQIAEFSDFRCPACQRASKVNTIILANHRQDASFVFKHYPLDPACNGNVSRMVHPGACQIAAASECAHRQGKFWAFHDLVFEAGPHYNIANLDADAQRVGLDVERFRQCLAAGEGLEAVKRDIAEGAKVKVTSTPTYLINGIPFAGGVTPAMFEEAAAVLRERSR